MPNELCFVFTPEKNGEYILSSVVTRGDYIHSHPLAMHSAVQLFFYKNIRLYTFVDLTLFVNVLCAAVRRSKRK